jgi:hypothetical protein
MKAFLIFTFCFLIFAFVVHAQSVPTSVQGIDLKLSADNPVPGQQLTVTAESYVSDLDSSNITWMLNGSLYQKGIGITSIQVKAPGLGKKLTVAVSAITSDNRELKTSIDIGSGNIDIIVENEGYTPPFFSGKVRLSYQNNYRIIAVPHLADSSGKEYDPKTLVYQWTKDTKVMQDQSGYGKQIFIWQDDVVPRQRMINVRAITGDGKAQAEKIVMLQAQGPFVTFYNNDSLYGPLYNKAIGNSVGLGKSGELSVLAVPYGFNKPLDGVGNLSFSWLVNSIEQTALFASQSIILRAPQNTGGSSDIQLQVKNDTDILQGAQNGFTAVFSAQGSQTATSTLNNYNGI